MKRYEVTTHTREDYTYGIWDNNMQAWKYIYDWGGTQTIDLIKANKVCHELNQSKKGIEYSQRNSEQ